MQLVTIDGIPEEVKCVVANLFHHYKESYHKGETGLSLLILLTNGHKGNRTASEILFF